MSKKTPNIDETLDLVRCEMTETFTALTDGMIEEKDPEGPFMTKLRRRMMVCATAELALLMQKGIPWSESTYNKLIPDAGIDPCLAN